MNANFLRDKRLQFNLTQDQLAKRCGLSRQAISFFECGDRRPKPENAQKIASVLQIQEWYKLLE